MKTQFLSDKKQHNEMWFSFNYNGETYLMVVSTTDKPFRGINNIKAIYHEDHQNEYANLPDEVVSEVYSEVLMKSVNVL